jgi:hypothetical protein
MNLPTMRQVQIVAELKATGESFERVDLIQGEQEGTLTLSHENPGAPPAKRLLEC